MLHKYCPHGYDETTSGPYLKVQGHIGHTSQKYM